MSVLILIGGCWVNRYRGKPPRDIGDEIEDDKNDETCEDEDADADDEAGECDPDDDSGQCWDPPDNGW